MTRCLALFLALTVVGALAAPVGRGALEYQWRRQRKVLVAVDYAIDDRDAARGLVVKPAMLSRYELYLRQAPPGQGYVYIGADRRVVADGKELAPLENEAEVLFTRDGLALFVDGRPILPGPGKWTLYWLGSQPGKPEVGQRHYPRIEVSDSFMRFELLDGNWKVLSGRWRLKQHGGGMPDDRDDAEDYNVQRAVNPFTVTGEGNGLLRYTESAWPHCQVEARFYFGLPRRDSYTNTTALPTGTDMLMVLGASQGEQVAFGWRGADRAFELLRRPNPASDWVVLGTYGDQRPPITDWVRIGLQLERGCIARGLLDGEAVLAADLPARVDGGLHVAAGATEMEFDDVRAWSLPEVPDLGSPVYVRSRNFARKREKNERADPEQFAQWARGAETFFNIAETTADNMSVVGIVTADELYGDICYESVPQPARAGRLPNGQYEFRLFGRNPDDPHSQRNLPILWHARFERGDDGWQAVDLPAWPAPEHREFTLRFRRWGEDGDQVAVQIDGNWVVVSEPITGPLRVGICRLLAPTSYRYGSRPHPEHHALFCRNLVTEFFEQAPSEWAWVEGSFRMDMRWACQDQWNFMACGSTGVPYMTSKTVFQGDQNHEFFVSLRPCVPADAGDPDIKYSYQLDPDRQAFNAHDGFYNRHDLNFSWCADGVNPMSGYAVIFAGYDNSRTVFLRQGKEVASTRNYSFLIPKEPGHGAVHWVWWRFRMQQHGNRIRVMMNDLVLFDYTDPEPLTGGHLGFWGMRNGWSLSRVSSAARVLDRDPHVMYVHGDAWDDVWQPVEGDSVQLEHTGDEAQPYRAVWTVGAGFRGIRHTPAKAVDLTATPILELPWRLDPTTKVNIHLQISGRSYIVQANASLDETRSFLTPMHERGFQFQLPKISSYSMKRRHLLGEVPTEGVIRIDLAAGLKRLDYAPGNPVLESLTIGNTSNDRYMLAGGDGANPAGVGLTFGVPRFLPAE